MKRFSIPIAVVMLQAGLLFCNLGLLPRWGDEVFTAQTIARPLNEILRIVAADIHPPLYYILLHLWPVHSVIALRAFSVLWALVSTILLDFFWTANWRPARRLPALLLFALSPCLFLYARMARSYSMQTALFLLAASLLWRWLRLRRGAAPAFAACLALLYTHYVPGLAIFAGVTALAYGPWLWTLSGALFRWGQAASFSSQYHFTGSAWAEHVLKLGFGAVSLSIGESFYFLTLLLVPWMGWLAWRGLRRAPPRLVAMIAIAAAMGYLGAARWVTYPFIAARLLWLLPFLMLAVSVGLGRRPALSAILVLASLASIGCYFRQENYLNKGYQAPLREVAGRLNSQAAAQDLILVDTFNTDAAALSYYLSGRTPLQTIDAGFRPDPSRTVWIVRNLRDVSPGLLTTRMETLACAARPRQQTFYLPYTGWQRLVLAQLMAHPPQHFYQLTRCAAPQ